MKRIYGLLMAGALIAGATSCSDFLDEDNKTGQTADLTYSTVSGLAGLDNSAFAYTRAWWGKEAGLGLSECGSDLFLGGGDNKQMSLITYNLTSASADGKNTADDACLDHYWELFFDAVDVCNNLLQYTASNTVITDKVRNQYNGDAYFLRALYYSQMVALWGPLPYNTEPITSTNTAPVREPENVVYAKILQDIDKALEAYKAADVMTKADAGEIAHGSYYAAMALKARVALYAASWLGNNAVEGYANLYQIAQKAAEDCIANSGASFYSRYSDTWNMNNENVADNKEAIWGVHYTSDLTKGSTSNCIPHRYKTDANGTHLDFVAHHPHRLHTWRLSHAADVPRPVEQLVGKGRRFQRHQEQLHLRACARYQHCCHHQRHHRKGCRRILSVLTLRPWLPALPPVVLPLGDTRTAPCHRPARRRHTAQPL